MVIKEEFRNGWGFVIIKDIEGFYTLKVSFMGKEVPNPVIEGSIKERLTFLDVFYLLKKLQRLDQHEKGTDAQG